MWDDALLIVEGVAGGYRRDHQILRSVSMKVRRGEVICVIGPNGAGKSTLLKTICGTVPFVSGSIRFQDEEILGLPPPQILRRGICYVPQGRRVFAGMTVRENLKMGAYTLDDARVIHRRMDDLLSLFPVLLQKLDHLAYQLSGGEQQMLAIARGLMLSPSLLMLDEPSLGLAPQIAALVFERIQELNRAGVTILMVEQQVKRALPIAARGYVMVLGETRLTDTAPNLLASDEVRALYIGGSVSET